MKKLVEVCLISSLWTWASNFFGIYRMLFSQWSFQSVSLKLNKYQNLEYIAWEDTYMSSNTMRLIECMISRLRHRSHSDSLGGTWPTFFGSSILIAFAHKTFQQKKQLNTFNIASFHIFISIKLSTVFAKYIFLFRIFCGEFNYFRCFQRQYLSF